MTTNQGHLDRHQLYTLHDDFWNMRLKKALIGNSHRKSAKLQHISRRFEDAENLELQPEYFTPEEFQDPPERLEEGGDPLVDGQVFNVIRPYNGIPWLPSIAGCTQMVSWYAQTVWLKKPAPDSWYDSGTFVFKPRRDWFEKLLEFTDYLVARYSDVAVITMDNASRGVCDLFMGLVGIEEACTALYDKSDTVKEFLMQIAHLHVEWAKRQIERIPAINGGYCNQWGLFCKGSFTRFQEDYAGLISQEVLEEFLLPCEELIVRSFDYQVLHTHSAIPHLAEWALGLEQLKCIEVTIDPHGPPMRDCVRLWNKILEEKCLIVSATVTQEEFDYMQSDLNPAGLLLDVSIVDEDIVDEDIVDENIVDEDIQGGQ